MKTLEGWWLVSDLDGTLINDQQQIVVRNLEPIRRFGLAGGKLVLATGRIETSVRKYHRQLALDTPAILYNGARVVEAGLTVSVYSRDLSREETWSLATTFDHFEGDIVPIFFADGEAYSDRVGRTLTDYERKDGIKVKPMSAWVAKGRPRATKVLCIERPDNINSLIVHLEQVVPNATLVRSESTYVEVLPPNVNKGVALKWLIDRCNIDPNRVVAVGDNLNDMELLQAAGCGIAVGDGHPELRRIADFVVGTCREGAVSQVVDYVFSR